MTITVRLDQETERKLDLLATREGLTKSELVRRCLLEYLNRRRNNQTPWELGEQLFGRFGSGRSDLSSRSREIIREKVHGKKGRR